jgi:hypothetical protein
MDGATSFFAFYPPHIAPGDIKTPENIKRGSILPKPLNLWLSGSLARLAPQSAIDPGV